jgi:hypothetical protein
MNKSSSSGSVAAGTVLLAAIVTSTSAIGQSQTPAAKPVPAGAAASAKAWTQTKTAWGDPDLQGVWTSDAARGIPRDRPATFGSRATLTDEEFAAKVKNDLRTRETAENAVGSFRNDGAWLNKSFRQTSLVVEPEDGRTPAFTEEALKRAAPRDRGTFGEGPFRDQYDFTLYDRCITRGIVGSIMPVVYGNGNRIIQAPGEVIISYEMVHDTRVIYMDGRPHLNPGIRQYLGDSRGHWDGNTLVIETTNFTDQTSIGGGNGNGLRHSADLKLTERITRIDADELRYEVHIDDPRTYVKPWTISLPLTSPPGYVLLPYECLEGDYAIKNALSAERAEDKAIEEDARRGIVRPRKGVQYER